MTEHNDDNDAEWLFLIDPGWQPTSEQDRPPAHVVLGGWFVDTDDTAGQFHPNPDYRPADEQSFIDPIDATLRLVLEDKAEPGQLLATLRGAVVGVAVDESGNPVVAVSPDQVPCVLVSSAPEHRRHARLDQWIEVSMAELAAALPDEGIDVLINPGAPASMRLLAAAVKTAVNTAT
ncbi:type VII secretion system-associated protein [Nocardia salmonicida]|uniref:type VII secretion system-associated protein n=1 Tax=Nocardia salmonicida TaxID=53431 RepID=UPI003679C760